ncbi:MAG: hypothetical protein RDU13_11535 [Elusimicrobiales bacterium]|nr:hypothetical protein [Elusimicrobiales bacterium]
MLARIKRPADVKTLTFYPHRQVDGLYALLQKNIPQEYMVRLTYTVPKSAIRVPAAILPCQSIKEKPFRSVMEMAAEFRRTYFPGFVKLHYPKKAWRKKLAEDCRYLDKAEPDMGLRLVRGRSTAGLMILLKWKYREKPLTLIAWVWIRKTLTLNERRQAQRLMLAWLKRKTGRIAGGGVDGFNAASQGFFHKAGFKVDCLNLFLPRPTLLNTPGVMPQAEWAESYKKIWKAVEDADYSRAMGFLTPLYKKYSRDFKVAKTYAMALGDYAETLNGARGKALKARSRALLRGLLRRLGNVRWEWSISARNEYYYHTGQFRKQYVLGLEAAAGGHNWGYYGQGVGAANYAYEHAVAGRRGLAAMWARRAVRSWETFFKFKPDYYNAYVHYALALGILGRLKGMEAALRKSASLSGKPASYKEFAGVRGKIAALGRH